MTVRAGLPPNWQEIASHVKGTTGRDLVLRAPDDAFAAGTQDVQVVVDGVLLGQFEFWWDEGDRAEAMADLRDALSPFLDEEFGTEDW